MDDVARWTAFVLGVMLFVATSVSMVKTLIVPRRGWSLFTSTLTRSLVRVFHGTARRLRSDDLADRFMGFLGPVALVSITVAMLASYTLAFALMLLPFAHETVGGALRESGSSVTTLGFESSAHPGPTVIDVLAGISGLVVIALTVAYLPTLYVILRERETPVRLVEARVGSPVTGAGLLAAHYESQAADELGELYRTWETWAARVADSHTKYPILIHFRLPRADSNWVTTLRAVLDAASLQLVLDPAAPRGAAQLWLRAGEACLHSLRHSLNLDGVELTVSREASREMFDEATSTLVAAGCTVRAVDDEAFQEWQELEGRYIPILAQVAGAVLLPRDHFVA